MDIDLTIEEIEKMTEIDDLMEDQTLKSNGSTRRLY